MDNSNFKNNFGSYLYHGNVGLNFLLGDREL